MTLGHSVDQERNGLETRLHTVTLKLHLCKLCDGHSRSPVERWKCRPRLGADSRSVRGQCEPGAAGGIHWTTSQKDVHRGPPQSDYDTVTLGVVCSPVRSICWAHRPSQDNLSVLLVASIWFLFDFTLFGS